ncbi:MAG: GTPase HflX, partial [Chloroflexales bacterium]
MDELHTQDGKRLHETATPRTRVLLIGAEIASRKLAWSAEDSLRELALLADTAGLEVVGQLFQRLDQPVPKFFIGPGKVQEVAALREQTGAGLLIFD